ncbi:MAG: HK97 family phage prohead protease [Beijerinckiaceae bacterium]|nr:HK97 family phage prohead protease [Beijerinckiaceae bacterium]
MNGRTAPVSPPSGRRLPRPAGRDIRPRPLSPEGADIPASPAPDAGLFEGYASLFGVMDLGRDVVMPGAFRHSLSRRGAGGIRLLWQHDPARPIGRWTRLSEDGRGLHVAGRLDLEQALAREVHGLMRRGLVEGLSIGYRTERERRDPETGLRRLDEVDLWEISLVTFPMLPQARITAVKALPGPLPAFPAIRPL